MDLAPNGTTENHGKQVFASGNALRSAFGEGLRSCARRGGLVKAPRFA